MVCACSVIVVCVTDRKVQISAEVHLLLSNLMEITQIGAQVHLVERI